MKKSAGILLYRFHHSLPEVLLVHPGGPFWKNKDAGAWSIPKGEFVDGEDPLDAAKREFEEEMGFAINGKFIELGSLKQKSGKLVFAWAIEKDFDADLIKSNHFEMEWPPGSGKMISVPEIDRGEWFSIETALEKILPGQAAFINELLSKI